MLIYDGDCGFCTHSVKFMRKRLKKPFEEPFEVVSWQSIDDLSKYLLTQEDVQQRVYFIHENGQALGGAAALSEVGLHMKMPWRLLARLARIPGLNFIAERIYRVVARNRHRLPGGTAACAIDDH
jgi:predicted DCC family thiol-disulfide oxidoreductase YuxK